MGGGARAGPVVTPHTLELTARGRIQLLQAPPDTARAYLPPEYRPGRVYSDTDSEKVKEHSLLFLVCVACRRLKLSYTATTL